jgi:hypothetical protein
MRKFIVLAIGATVVGWVVNSLLRAHEEELASSMGGPPPGKRAVGGSLSWSVTPQSAAPSRGATPEEAIPSREEDPTALAVTLPPEQVAPLQKPPNVTDFESFQGHRVEESETGDSASAPASQNANARMKQARDAVDQRFRRLPEEGERGSRSAA